MPIAFLYEGMQVATAIFSYLGAINFGYIADRSAFPDLPRLGQCMEASFAELLDVARASQAAPTPAKKRPAAPRPSGARPHPQGHSRATVVARGR
jgi:hypothetical protein